MDRVFADRRHAGRELAAALVAQPGFSGRDAVVLALPRGGVPVAFEVAMALDAPLGVFVVRKLGVPGHRELAMGAIASGGVRILNGDLVRQLGIPEGTIQRIVDEEMRELDRRDRLYNVAHPLPPIAGRFMVLVDDGLATGSTMRAAVEAVRRQKPASITVAVPVAAPDTCFQLRDEADDVVCLTTPEPFNAVGLWYRVFDQTTDAEVRWLLDEAWRRRPLIPSA
jgi:putative phosphoribosyl transferase